MSAEDKLGKSLDSIIEENKSSFKGRSRGDRPRPGAGGGGSGSKPKGMRIDGPRSKNLRVQGLSRPQGQGQRSAPRGGAGTDAGLGVRSAGIKKRSARAAPVYTYDEDMDTGDYGAPAPRRQQFQRGGGYGGGRGGRGGYGGGERFEDVGAGYKRREVPKGNSDGFWSHDLYDEREQGPPRRQRVVPSQQNAQPNGFTLTVSNLDYTVSNKDIKELFETCGPLLDAFVHFDNSGRSNGLATIVYKSKVAADQAIAEYDGVKLDGKELRIQYAVEEEEEHHITKLASGKLISRPADGPAPNSFKRAISALPVRGMGGDTVRSAGPRTGGGGGGMGRMGGGMGDRMGGGGRGRPAARGGAIGNRLRSTVTRTKADLDAEMDSMQE